MAKRSKKPPRHEPAGAAIVAQPVNDENEGDDPYAGKDPAAVELGRRD